MGYKIMDKKYFPKLVISGILLHLVIISFYVTSYHPINRLATFRVNGSHGYANISVARQQRMNTYNLFPSSENPESNSERGKNMTVLLQLRNLEQARDQLPKKAAVETYNFSLIHNSGKTLLDTHHPQYHPAFASYTAASIDCPITPGIHPYYVSVTKEPRCDNTTNQITIQYPGTQTRNFSLCFSPLHSNYNATFRLIQSIELNRLLGASHFYFYNFSTSPQTDQILRQYEREGLVTILPWPLPHLETWYYAQIVAINDCIYRNRITSRYVVVIDTDEFIVPSRHSDWLDLINDVIHSPSLREFPDINRSDGQRTFSLKEEKKNQNQTTTPSFGSFMFKCSYFADRSLNTHDKEVIKANNFELTDGQNEFFKEFPSEPIKHLKRNDYFFEHGRRSKLIVRPETVVSHGIHKTTEHVAGYQTAYVDTETAYLHHYRPYKIKLTNTLDTSVLRFKDELYLRLQQAINTFPTIFATEIISNLSKT